MCGLFAFMGTSAAAFSMEVFHRALSHMHRRGPDAEGAWHEPGVWLGHRRLAILDLELRSNQPFVSVCGRYLIVYNGEIYNYRSLRAELVASGVPVHTASDTEVIVELFAREGAVMLSRLRGMFAFVIWDRIAQRAFVARDPYGIKPLYWAQTNDGVFLASQVRALLATGVISRAPSAKGQAGFWLLGSVPEPYTWYQAIQALPAGHYAWIDNGRMGKAQLWWDVTAAWRDTPKAMPPPAEVRERVRLALRESIAAHLVADVPIGVFLSGGIDSGAVAGLMLEMGARNVHGVTIAYDEFSGTPRDEAPHAATLAAYYGITHHVRRVTREEFLSDLPRILSAIDQPSVDGVNTWYASKAVAELGLKVVLSGVGGDELFQGYSSFRQLPSLVSAWRPLSRLPGAMPMARAAMGLRAHHSGNERWRQMPEWARTMAGAWWLRRGLFSPTDLPSLMGRDLSHEGLLEFSPDAWVGEMSGQLATDGRLAVGQIESSTYLRNQLLRDSDWASMDHSVELRTPLADAWLLREVQPLLGAFSQFPGKRLLADASEKPLPEALINRTKTGFSIPVQTWLRRRGVSTDIGAGYSWAREVAGAYGEGFGI
jgi:asparagine synthase (glutamine-hydrolysing)